MSNYDREADATRVVLVGRSPDGGVTPGAVQDYVGSSDGRAATEKGQLDDSRLLLWNGTTWDRARSKGTGWQGVALVRSSDGTEVTSGPATDGDSGAGVKLYAHAHNDLFNGASWDRQRGNTEGTLLASAARTATVNTGVQTNHNARGVMLWLVVSAIAVPGTTLQLTLRSTNPAGGSGHFIHGQTQVFVPIVGGRYGLVMYPGITVVASTADSTMAAANAVLPRSWFAVVTPGDANSVTYDLGYSLIV